MLPLTIKCGDWPIVSSIGTCKASSPYTHGFYLQFRRPITAPPKDTFTLRLTYENRSYFLS